ncbi:MAG: hypothetical protein K2P78_03135 [Gemmataceae bacterium]|nr:hypothetical protein [Gemmataceae bacterium]
MPIVATCPYCRAGGVRAPDKCAGMSANCPKCKSSFTIIPDEGLPGWAKPQAAAETQAHALVPDVTEPSPVLPAKEPPRPAPAAAPAVVRTVRVEQEEPTAAPSGMVTALLALTVFGLAVAASQFPFGRFIAPGLALVGLAIGLVGLAGEGKAQLVAAAGSALNVLAIGLVFLAPGWLGLDSWRGATPEGPKVPQAVGHGTGTATPTEWVNATNSSWAEGDMRVTVRSITVAPVELVGPGGAAKTPKEPVLQIVLRLANEGVERRVELTGWAAGGDGAELADPAGKPVKRKRFEPGWEPRGPEKPAGLFPGKYTDVLLVFEPPPALLPKSKEPRPEYLRLQLPGAAVGVPDPAKFQIPGTFVLSGKLP